MNAVIAGGRKSGWADSRGREDATKKMVDLSREDGERENCREALDTEETLTQQGEMKTMSTYGLSSSPKQNTENIGI